MQEVRPSEKGSHEKESYFSMEKGTTPQMGISLWSK
jgi:hypothetical protein